MLSAQETLFVTSAENSVGPAAAKEVGKGLRFALHRPAVELSERLAAAFGGGCSLLRTGLLAVLSLLALGLLGCAELGVAGPTATPEVVVLREEPVGPERPLRSSRLMPQERLQTIQIPTLTPEPREAEKAAAVQIVVATATPVWNETLGERDAGGSVRDLSSEDSDPLQMVREGAESDLDNGSGGRGGRFGEEPPPAVGPETGGGAVEVSDAAAAHKLLVRQDCLKGAQSWLSGYSSVQNAHRAMDFAVVRELFSEFVALNSDCVRIAEWDARVSEKPVCVSLEMPLSYPAGARLRAPREMQKPGRVQPALGNTQQTEGSVLVHFDRLPYSDFAGCWFYHGYEKVWAWEEFVNGRSQEPVGGIDWPDFPECWDALAPELALRKNFILSHDRVAAAVETVRREGPERCDNENWDARARETPAKGCPEPLDDYTGLRPDGSLLIHWAAAPPEYYACWFMSSEGEWERYARY